MIAYDLLTIFFKFLFIVNFCFDKKRVVKALSVACVEVPP